MERIRQTMVTGVGAQAEAPMPAWVDEPLYVRDIVPAGVAHPPVPVLVTGPGMAIVTFRRRRRR